MEALKSELSAVKEEKDKKQVKDLLAYVQNMENDEMQALTGSAPPFDQSGQTRFSISPEDRGPQRAACAQPRAGCSRAPAVATRTISTSASPMTVVAGGGGCGLIYLILSLRWRQTRSARKCLRRCGSSSTPWWGRWAAAGRHSRALPPPPPPPPSPLLLFPLPRVLSSLFFVPSRPRRATPRRRTDR